MFLSILELCTCTSSQSKKNVDKHSGTDPIRKWGIYSSNNLFAPPPYNLWDGAHSYRAYSLKETNKMLIFLDFIGFFKNALY